MAFTLSVAAMAGDQEMPVVKLPIDPIIEIGPRTKVAESPSDGNPSLNGDPVCNCQDQCEAMWVSATEGVQRYSGMRIRIATDYMLETYVPRIGLVGSVSKRPLGNGRYEISPLFLSRPSSGKVADLAVEARSLMVNELRRTANRIGCTTDP